MRHEKVGQMIPYAAGRRLRPLGAPAIRAERCGTPYPIVSLSTSADARHDERLREALAPLLFHDTEIDAARAERSSPVAKTEPSEVVKAKKATKRSADGHRVMSFAELVAHLGTLTRNTMRVPLRPKHRFTLYSTPTPLQEATFKLLDLNPLRVQ